MKSAKEFLQEANQVVPRISSQEAVAKYNEGGGVFVDVRDSGDISKTGTIKDAVKIPRGFLEFAADDQTQAHNPAMKKDAEIYLVCAAGGQAALAGKTLMDMGFQNVVNIGGVNGWIEAGGPTED